jgi:hypothetical protein
MADQLSLRGGTTAEHATFTGANKEVTVDTTKKTLVVNDGATVGGHPLMRENASNSALALGSAGTPSLKFTGDTNTGIYSPGADQLAVATNGTGRLFVDASGNVGVGGSPSHLLDCRASSTPTIRVLETTNGPDGRFLASASDVQIGSYGGSPFCIYTNSTEKVRVTTGGLVGIGTSSPGQGQAQINTTAAGASDINAIALNLTNNSTAAGTGVSLRFSPGNVLTALRGSYINSLISGANGSDLQFWTCGDGVVPGERMRIDSSGNVGIGTTTPTNTDKLEIQTGSLSAPGLWVQTGGTTSAYPIAEFRTGSNLSALLIRGDGASVFSGKVLVGTSSDAQTSTVTVQGNSASTTGGAIVRMRIGTATPADGNTTGVIKFEDSGGGTGAEIEARRDGGTWSGSSKPSRLVFSTTSDSASSPTERLRITSTGQVRLAGAGITFNGDTAAANELDDYEEGTFTPTAGAGITINSGTPAYSGVYTKIGRMVHITITQTAGNITATVGTGAVFTGLPFTPGTSLQACSVTNGNPDISGSGLIYNSPGTGAIYIGFTATSQTSLTFTGTYFV